MPEPTPERTTTAYVCPPWCVADHPRSGADGECLLIHEHPSPWDAPLPVRIEAYRDQPPVLVLAGHELTAGESRALAAQILVAAEVLARVLSRG